MILCRALAQQEGWMSGLNQRFTKPSLGKPCREFESRSLRNRRKAAEWVLFLRIALRERDSKACAATRTAVRVAQAWSGGALSDGEARALDRISLPGLCFLTESRSFLQYPSYLSQ